MVTLILRRASCATHHDNIIHPTSSTSLNLVVYLLTYILRMCERWEGRTPKEERPILHDDVGRWTRHCTPLTFRIIGGGGDSLLAPLRAEESPEAARCLPRRAAYGGRRRQGLRLRRSVSRPISCSTTDFPTRMLLTCEGGALRFDSLLLRGLGAIGRL